MSVYVYDYVYERFVNVKVNGGIRLSLDLRLRAAASPRIRIKGKLRKKLGVAASFLKNGGLILDEGTGGEVGRAEDPGGPRAEGDFGRGSGPALRGEDEGFEAGRQKESPEVSGGVCVKH